ncbi:MAG: hypothetical protein NPIRA04_12420 [Nitrospirales bacterium]|nr:MAG: hypothetical protein NPIRA04_12420 [Nitrospirales bacterium]
MLYLIHKANDAELTYVGGQDPIVHLEADFYGTISWAEQNRLRWAFTLSNAGSGYFEDRCDLSRLDEIDWNAVHAISWSHRKEGKQAEFLIEKQFPWELITRIGVCSYSIYEQVTTALRAAEYKPGVEIRSEWYY